MIKTAARLIGTFLAIPYRIGYTLRKALLGEQRAMTAVSERIARVPGLRGVYTRAAFYRGVLSHVGTDAYIGFMTLFSKPGTSIGDRAYIGRFCTLGHVQLGEDAMLADGVQVLSGRHQHGSESQQEDQALRDNPQQFAKVTIGKGAWIGAGAVVMSDVGDGAIVGAGAVVVRPVPAGVKVGGVPAKPIGN